ncbi:MAG TPA: nuclear transport factor 2 family protein [Chthoniobacterales bacterium]
MLKNLAFVVIAAAIHAGSAAELPPSGVVHATPVQQDDAQVIAAKIARQYEAANARDFDGYMAAFWHSPLLVYVVDGTVWTGWAEVRGHIERDYPSLEQTPRGVLERLETRFVDAQTAITVEYWTAYFPRSRIHGMSVGNWRKLAEGWYMVQASTSSTDGGS